MWRRSLILVAIAAAACGPESVPFGLAFQLERGDTNTCPSDSCELIAMTCGVAMQIRIADLSDDSAYISECYWLDGGGSLCDLAEIDLPAEDIPNEMVRVQVVVWRQDDLLAAGIAPNQCPSNTTFNLANTPMANPSPVLGGQSYFKVGSSRTARVTLQCMFEEALSAPECGGNSNHVTVGIDEFDLLGSVDQATANRLDVSVAEPSIEPGLNQFVLSPDDTTVLSPIPLQQPPRWQADLEDAFEQTVCIQANNRLELAGATTIRCLAVESLEDLDLAEDDVGMYVPKAILDRVSMAVGGIPESGMVLGVVVDSEGLPAAGVTVTASAGTVRYLSEDYTSTLDSLGLPLSETTAKGAFVSVDVPFGFLATPTEWHAERDSVNEEVTQIGGLVRGKLTFVKLKLKPNP